MRILVYILSIACLDANGQAQKGTVTDRETYKPIPEVVVTNLSAQRSVLADRQGNFSIPATKGDVIYITSAGYHSVRRIANPDSVLMAHLLPLSVKLPEYTLHDHTLYQKDSMEITSYYSKALNREFVKVGFSSANGGGITGLIGGPVQRISRTYKLNKRFKENVRRDLEQRYIDTRYTPALVKSLTGLVEDSLIAFINLYQMDYSFAHHATELELKAWIRNNYKEYTQQLQKPTSHH